MTNLSALRAASTGELRSRIPSLRRVADGPTTGGAASAAASELRRIARVLAEREEAEGRLEAARARVVEEWSRVAALEEQLADARASAREADREVADALRASLGG